MSVTFTKLFSSITASTVWCRPSDTRVVWITMLAMADRHGRVWASIPGLAKEAAVSVAACRTAINEFLSPDPDSRTKVAEGRRIEPIDGGWRLINHAKYRAIRDEEERRAYKAEKQREYRTVDNVDKGGQVLNIVDCGSHNAEAEADTEAKEQIPPLPPKGETIKSSEFFDAWNQLCGKLPKVEKLTDGRSRKIQARLRHGLTLSRFCEAIRGCTAKPFLSGNNERGWTATFDWLIANDENAEKAIVNPYGNAANGKHVQAGADNQKQISEDEAHALWQSMSEEFKRANPWGSHDAN